jgi:hemolysin III
MFTASAVYHRLSHREQVAAWTRPADHAAIFAAIAGTATPVIATTTSGRARFAALGATWSAAAAAAVGRARRIRSGRAGGGASYLVVAWGTAALLPALVSRHGAATALKLLAGGAVYSAGAAVLATRTPDPFPEVFGYHEVWHLLTLVGAALHFAAVRDVTRYSNPTPLTTPSTS